MHSAWQSYNRPVPTSPDHYYNHQKPWFHELQYHIDPVIFAVGDCAEVGGKWAPYIAPINQAKSALVQSILGQPIPATIVATPIIVKTPVMPLCVMPAIADGEWKIEQKEDGLTAGCYDQQGQLLGFVLLGQRQQNERSQWLSTFNKNQAA